MPACLGGEEELAEVRWRVCLLAVCARAKQPGTLECFGAGSQPQRSGRQARGSTRPVHTPWRELELRFHFAVAVGSIGKEREHLTVLPAARTHALTMAALRTSLAPSAFALHSRQFQRFLALPVGVRYASSVPPPKPRLLEKPERFNPPSHPSRLRSKHRSYGAPLAEAERRAQKTRSYPHMMPAEGTFTYWFLTNRKIHLWISIVRVAPRTTIERLANRNLGNSCYAHRWRLDWRLPTLDPIYGSSPA